jgi:Animal haem peroxidase
MAAMDDKLQNMPTGSHGGQGSQDAAFTRLLNPSTFTPLRLSDPDHAFAVITGVLPDSTVASGTNQGADDPNDDPDPLENPRVPAGYTYFGQFIDHDLTFDTTSSLNTTRQRPNNERTPRLDLDCVYGLGFNGAPYMYEPNGKLVIDPATGDLPRAANDRAIIGDPRNDENSIVCQVQRGFINFHNKVVDRLIASGTKPGVDAWTAARREVQWTYQTVILNDYLVRIIQDDVRGAFQEAKGPGSMFRLYKHHKWNALPLEFTAAAYRFGHSMIRNAYRLNPAQPSPQRIFDGMDDGKDSLVGFGALDPSHHVKWGLLLPAPGMPNTAPGQAPANDGPKGDKNRLQFAYKMDTSLVAPLLALPPRIAGNPLPADPFRALAARNLKRAYNFRVPSGQDVARALHIEPLPADRIEIRTNGGTTSNGFVKVIDLPGLDPADAWAIAKNTPLWLYCLMEAQQVIPRDLPYDDDRQTAVTTALGPVGGRILLEVFHGILLADGESVIGSHAAENWVPMANPDRTKLTLWDIFAFAGETM